MGYYKTTNNELFQHGFYRCTKCHRLKRLRNFHKNKARKNGYSNLCKKCELESSRQYRAELRKSKKLANQLNEPPEKTCTCCHKLLPILKFPITDKRTYVRATVCLSCRSLNRRLARHGVTAAEYWEEYELTQGRCSCCDKEVKALCIDVDPSTGILRGLLCRACTTAKTNPSSNPGKEEDLNAYLEYRSMS